MKDTAHCFFVSDLHGSVDRYEKLFAAVVDGRPDAVFIGGDLLPHAGGHRLAYPQGFIRGFLGPELRNLHRSLGERYPRIFVILGNDDGRFEEEAMLEMETHKLWTYVHGVRVPWGNIVVYGYAYVPPTPFRLKDWERYDVSRYTDPDCISPEEGLYSTTVSDSVKRFATIEKDLEDLTGGDDLSCAVFLFHTPPYGGMLDLLSFHPGKFEHETVDMHAGSIAVKRFIEARQPLITLHGHIHESARMTGSWKERIGRTSAFSAAHDGPELALVRFYLEEPDRATRELI